MAEATQSAANQAREMQARTAKPGGKDEVKKDADGNIIGANITTEGKPIPQVLAQEPPGLAGSNLVGGVGIYGSGQDQDDGEVQSKGEEALEERAKAAEDAEAKAEEEEQAASEAAKAASEAARKPAKASKK